MNPPDPVTQSFNSSSLSTQKEFFYTAFEPKAINRFVCRIINKDNTHLIPTYLIRRVDRPSVIRVLDKWVWNEIEIDVYDPIVPSGAQIFAEYIRAGNETFDMEIDVFGPVGDTVEKWKITDARVIEVNFGTLDWDSYPSDGKSKIAALNFTRYYKGGDAATIRAKISYKYAELIY